MAIGKRLRRIEDRPLLTGEASFVDDIDLEGALEAVFVRSPHAHGLLGEVERSEALAVPGVEAVLTAEELGGLVIETPSTNPAVLPPDQPVLAAERVRFVGEPVALVLADSRYTAEDGAEAVFVDVDPLEILTSPERALEEDAPEIHPGTSNAVVDFGREEGDVDAAFEAAATVVERTFDTPRQSAMPIEARAVLATPEQGGGVHLRSSSQAPHKTRQALSEVLGIDRERVRVTVPDVGGGFGLKAHTYPEEIAIAAAAIRTGRPVKWTEDRVENLGAASHARGQHHRIRLAASETGQILALDVDMLCDQGAYGAYPHGVALEALTTSGMLPGPYAIRNFRLRCRTALTNKSPEGAYRGVGFAVATFVHERMLEVLATETGIDPVELRRRNLIASDAFPYASITGQLYDNGDYARALDLAVERIGYSRDRGRGRRVDADGHLVGIGIASYVEPTGMNSAVFQGRGMSGIAGFDAAHVALDQDGSATVWTTTPAIGQGTDTTMTQVASEFLGLDVTRIRVARSDTSVGDLHGTGSFASRSAVSAGGALREAGETIRRRLIEDAAEQLEAAEVDLELTPEGEILVAGSPARSVSVADLVATAPEDRYRVSSEYDPPATAYPYATHACVASVDPETGEVHVERYVVAEDCGVLINPIVTEGQMVGAVAQGIGGALYESHDYDEDGQLRTSSLMDYLVPTAGEIPAIEADHLEIPSPTTWGGVKGVGEGGTIGACPTVVNAVCDAVGAEFNHFPVTPEQIVAALRSNDSG